MRSAIAGTVKSTSPSVDAAITHLTVTSISLAVSFTSSSFGTTIGRMKHAPHVTGLQHPPIWRDSISLRDRAQGEAERKRRSWSIGSNPLYEYGTGINFVVLSGKVVREPRVHWSGNIQFVWFRLCVPNLDNERQRLFIPVRSHAELAEHVWSNVSIGDEVAVTGRIYSMRRGKAQFVALIAERVSSSYPMQLDLDARFVRVRVDLWNRMTSCIESMEPHKVPEKQRRDLLAQFRKMMGMQDTIGDEVDPDQLDPDPSSNQDYSDDPSDDGDDRGGG